MAEKDYVTYREDGALATGYIAKPRTLEAWIDFTLAGNQTAGSTDSLNLFEIPKNTMVLGAGLEQVTAGSAGNTYAARIGTVVLSGTLASDAAAGTAVLTADVTGGHPYITTSDVDFNLISASGVRSTGVARAWIVIQEGNRPQGRPRAAARDTSTGLS